MKKNLIKLAIVILIIKLSLVIFWSTKNGAPLTLVGMQAHYQELLSLYVESPTLFSSLFLALVLVISYLPVPSGSLLVFVGGAFFSMPIAVGLYIVGYMFGVSGAFLTSRFLFRDFFKEKLGEIAKKIDAEVEYEGELYLLTLRFIPIFPSFIINYSMGLTAIRLRTFFLLSGVGRLPMATIYANAGKQLSKITSLEQLLSTRVVISFVLLGLLPWILKLLWKGSLKYFVIKKNEQKKDI